jgi:peroxiredoxin
MTLHYLQEQLPNIQLKGANVILTPELPDKSMSTVEKHELQFEVLSDVGNKASEGYGIVFKLTDVYALRSKGLIYMDITVTNQMSCL